MTTKAGSKKLLNGWKKLFKRISKKAKTLIDVPDIVETGNEIVIPAEGLHITFEKHFHATPNLQVTILDKTQGDDEFITNLDSAGFDICLKNFEQPIVKTINYVAQGY